MLGWAAFGFLTSLIALAQTVMRSSAPVAGKSMALLATFGFGVLLMALLAVWRYNFFVFPGRFDVWNRTYLCQRCATLCLIEPDGTGCTVELKT
jgi:hypothetical protein